MANKAGRHLMGLAALVGLLMAPVALAEHTPDHIEITPPYTHTPPKNLKMVGDHWTPYDPPTTFDEGANVYIIVQGDTLWDLAEANLGDPYLWPRIWEANQYILDAHWIYPGDPLVIPDLNAVPGDLPGSPDGPLTPMGPIPVPVAYDWDVHCSGFISKDFHSDAKVIEILNGDEGMIGTSPWDIIYTNNPDQSIQAGTEYQLIRPMDHIYHPDTEDHLGRYYRMLGRARAVCTTDGSATLELVDSCQDVRIGDKLRIWEEVPIPIAVVPTIDKLDRWCAESSGKLKANIIHATDDIMSVGEGHVVNIDVGSDDNIAPGDFFTIYKYYDPDYYHLAGWDAERWPRGAYDQDDLPRFILGELVVLLTEKNTATARITTSAKQIEVGAKVELVAR